MDSETNGGQEATQGAQDASQQQSQSQIGINEAAYEKQIGERAGSGMDKIFGGWEWAGYLAPSYEVAYGPDRTTLTLPLVSADSTGEKQSKSIEDNRRQSKFGEGRRRRAVRRPECR